MDGPGDAPEAGRREALGCIGLAALFSLPILWAVVRTGVEIAPYECPKGKRGTVVRAFGTTFFASGLTKVGIVRGPNSCGTPGR